MKKYLFKTQLLSLAAFCGIVLAFSSCANEDVAQNITGSESDNDKNLTAFVAGEEATTRTSLDYNSGNFYWEAGDYIYVKDDNGVLQKSSNAPTSKVASFKYMVPGKFTAKTSYKVYYLGKNSDGTSVSISTDQSQTAPNNTAHFGTAGDYGTATANKVSSKQQFKFELEHQPAYLVFQPYTSNKVLHNCYLTKIEVSSDNDIAETYTVNPTTGSLVASSGTGAKQIVLATQDPTSGSTYNNGFPLTNNSASVTTNGAYMVIKPGTHTLRVRYWVKDVATDVEGTITKTYSSTAYASNTYYDMTADLNVKDYRGDKYYMWDAQQNYWSGHEWNSANPWQPTLTSQPANPNYPQSNTDLRYRNEAFTYGVDNPATHTSCKDLPNVNEMTWYAARVIHVGTQTNYGLPWVTYTKVVCGLRRSQSYRQKVIITPRSLSTALIGVQMEAVAVGLLLRLFLPLPMQTNTSTCPSWVTTTLVSCTALATTATIGRQVLSHGAATPRTTCASAVMTSTCTAPAAPTGSGQRRFSSSRDYVLKKASPPRTDGH